MAFLTLQQMLDSIPDGGANTAADVRAIVEDLVKSKIWAPYSVDNAEDVWWQSNSGDFTTLTVTGSQTITESDGRLSVSFSGQTAGDYNAFLKARTFAVGDAFVVSLQGLGLDVGGAEHAGAGLVFSDGTAAGSNAVVGHIQWDPGSTRLLLVGRHGTFTALTTAPWVSDAVISPTFPALYIKLIYQAVNTFRLQFSPDGKTFSAFGEADISKTMTPTHFGVAWSDTSTTPNVEVGFGPICKVA